MGLTMKPCHRPNRRGNYDAYPLVHAHPAIPRPPQSPPFSAAPLHPLTITIKNILSITDELVIVNKINHLIEFSIFNLKGIESLMKIFLICIRRQGIDDSIYLITMIYI